MNSYKIITYIEMYLERINLFIFFHMNYVKREKILPYFYNIRENEMVDNFYKFRLISISTELSGRC